MGKRTPARSILASNTLSFRQHRGWSQQELATKAKIRQALVSAIEVGSANPTLESLDKIAKAFGVEIADLLVSKSS